MRLSEAIRAGAKMKPAGRGSESCVPTAENVCALGAAALAGGLEGNATTIYGALSLTWPILNERLAHGAKPTTHSMVRSTVMEAIWLLNDQDRWSREAIADWVEQAEQEYEGCKGDRT